MVAGQLCIDADLSVLASCSCCPLLDVKLVDWPGLSGMSLHTLVCAP